MKSSLIGGRIRCQGQGCETLPLLAGTLYKVHKNTQTRRGIVVSASRGNQDGTAFSGDARSFPLHDEIYFDSTNIFGTPEVKHNFDDSPCL